MNRQDLEQRLRTDARRVAAQAPDTPRQNVLRRLRREDRADDTGNRLWKPALAAAFSMAAAVAIVLFAIPESIDDSTRPIADTSVRSATLDPDRLLARQEAELQAEWQSLEADFRTLRQQMAISATNGGRG